ncbi:MAG: hypothetical protein KC620_01830 [Myxococcales bacterium]|nr:hypothetical protein [Myxococcales bacterium]
MAKRPKLPEAAAVGEGVDLLLADEAVVWFPVKHYSPACALHVERLIAALNPAAVLVEGPDDATALIPWIVHADTAPPLTIFSAYADHKNVYGMNGVLSPAEDMPARFRSWWPLTAFCAEFTALRAGHAVGAELAFIDLPLPARIPLHHARRGEETEVVGDHHLATSAYFEALRRKQRRRSFEEFWQANFEAGGLRADSKRFRRAVLTFAWCARYAGTEPGAAKPGDDHPLDRDGTLTREAHMRWHIDRAVKTAAGRPVVVVTGAFHSVALPFTKAAKAKVKADKQLETLVTPYSFAALARLYSMARTPGYEQAVYTAAAVGEARPYDAAAMRLLVEVMRRARERNEGVSTADAIGAWHAARALASLRGNAEVTAFDLLDAAQMGYVKGDHRLVGGAIRKATHEVLIGHAHGHLTPEAGILPILGDFYAQAKAHRLDLTGVEKTVRLDLHRQRKHREKSAFLHQCDLLAVPVFGALGHGGDIPHFKGPDPIAGTDLHLISETWAVRWRETVDDRLVELADRGASLAEAAGAELRGQAANARDDAAASTALLLRCARMLLLDLFDDLLDAVEQAIEADASFTHLVDALNHFVVLHAYRDALATKGHDRLLGTIAALFIKAVRVLPGVAHTDADGLPGVLDRVRTLARFAVTFDAVALDRALLLDALARIAEDDEATAALRGAAYGVLHGFGAARERVIAAALLGYLRSTETRALQAGGFLDGLFQSARSVFLRSPRLMQAINDALATLEWQTFKTLLPDLRRAFTQFIPSELDRISVRVAAEIGLDERPDPDAPLPEPLVRLAAAADARVAAALEGWL